MQTSVQKSRRSRSRQEDRKSLDSKRGIFTSMLDQKPNANPYLESSLPGFKQSFQRSRQGIEHQYKGFVESREYLNVPHTVHTNYHMNQVTNRGEVYHKTPPPQVRFNYINNSHKQSPIKYIPIPNNPGQRASQHLSRSFNLTGQQQNSTSYYPTQNVQIRKTFIPQHIYNHIPSPPPQSHPLPPQPQPQGSGQSDEAYNLLLRQYQKLFSKFQSECTISKELEETIQRLKEQLKNQPHTHISKKSDQNYSLNIQLLHDKLYKYYEKYVDQILRQRKQKCIKRVSKLFESAHQQINITVIEESSSSHWVS